MKNQEQILAERSVAEGTKNYSFITIISLSILAVLLLVLNLIQANALIYRFPVKEFLWTDDARAVCAAIPLTEPNISPAKLKDFAAGAAVGLNSWDYLNWKRMLDTTMDMYMTVSAKDKYREAIRDTVNLVENSYTNITAIVRSAPIIVEEGKNSGLYYWIVQVPVSVFYRTASNMKSENRLLEFSIIRVAPSPLNPNGVAIDAVKSTQDTMIWR